MKNKLIILSALIALLLLVFWVDESRKGEILKGTDYSLSWGRIIKNSEENLSFKKPFGWYLHHEEDVLEIFSTQKKHETSEDCPIVRKGCSILVGVKEDYLKSEKLISDINLALEQDQRKEIREGIEKNFQIINISGFEAVQEHTYYHQEIGSVYLVNIPVRPKNYTFALFAEPDKGCERAFQRFLTTIKIN